MELESKINKGLSKYKIRSRGIEFRDDFIIIKAEVQAGSEGWSNLVKLMKSLKCRRVNGFFGKWVFKKING